MNSMLAERNYASYLLRLRLVQSDGQMVWVASIQSTATGKQRSFASIEALVRFLQSEFGKEEIETIAEADIPIV